MVGLPDGEKSLKICVADRRTDRRTDILPSHSPRYEYASRGKNAWVLVYR